MPSRKTEPVRAAFARQDDPIPPGVNVLWRPHPGPQTEALLLEEDEICAGGAKGGGKGQPLHARILTPFGWTTMGKLRVGSLISNPTGGTAYVIAVYPLGERDIFAVTFADGASTLVTDDHLWLARLTARKIKADRRYYPFDDDDSIEAKVYTTAFLKNRIDSENEKHPVRDENGNGASAVLIPLTQPVEYSPGYSGSAATVDPYVLGVLLGDGCLRGGWIRFSSDDLQIVDIVRARTGLEFVKAGGSDWRVLAVTELRDKLTALKVYGCLAHDKFIPDCYKWSSTATRRELIQGLMDTDGYADARGHCSFISVSEQLADDMRGVLWSLGYKVSKTRGSAGYRDPNGHYVQCRDAFTLYIYGSDPQSLFKLMRKRERCGKTGKFFKDEPMRRMVSIEKVGCETAQCIQVDHPNNLYITDDFIVTHNTALGIAWLMKGNPYHDPAHEVPCDITYLNHRYYRALVLRKNVIDLGDWIDKARRMYEPFGGVFRERPSPLFEFRTGAKIVLGHLDDADTYTKYQGQEFQRFLLEEATLVPDLKSYLMVRSCIRSVHPELHCQTLLTCNPGGPGHAWVRDRFIKPKGPDGRIIQPNTRINDPLTGETRIFLPMKLKDNPALANDPGYVKKLMGLPEAERRAFLDGDWDSLSGIFFSEFRPTGPLTGEPEEARHVIAAKPLKPWLNRLIAMDWGYAHDGAAYWGCENDDGRFHVYRELVRSRLGAEAWGVEIALASIEDLKGLEQNYLTLYLSPDAWEKRSDTRTIADQLAAGIRRVLGPNSVLLTEEETGDADQVDRMRHQQGYGIMVRRAPNQRIAGAQYIRSQLRWWPLTKVAKETFSHELFLRLLRADPVRAIEYRDAFMTREKQEVLPGLLIHDSCPCIIEVLQNVVHSLSNPEDVEKRDGDDPYDGFRYLVFAHSREKRREPFEEHFNRRLEQVTAMHGGVLDGNTRVWVARKAEEDYKAESEAVSKPIYFPRAAGRRAKETWRN